MALFKVKPFTAYYENKINPLQEDFWKGVSNDDQKLP